MKPLKRLYFIVTSLCCHLVFFLSPNLIYTDMNEDYDGPIRIDLTRKYSVQGLTVYPPLYSSYSFHGDLYDFTDSPSSHDFNYPGVAGMDVLPRYKDNYDVDSQRCLLPEDDTLNRQPSENFGLREGRTVSTLESGAIQEQLTLDVQTQSADAASENHVQELDRLNTRTGLLNYPKNQGPAISQDADYQTPAKQTGSDPIVYANGEFLYTTQDMFIPGAKISFTFVRTYRSRANYYGPLGYGWDHNFNQHILQIDDKTILYHNGRGGAVKLFWDNSFNRNENRTENKFTNRMGYLLELYYSHEDETWRLLDRNGQTLKFDRNGRLTSVCNRQSTIFQLFYIEDENQKQIDYIIDNVGRKVHFVYNENSLLTQVYYKDENDGILYSVSYQYDVNDDLAVYTDAEGSRFFYEYLTGYEGRTV